MEKVKYIVHYLDHVQIISHPHLHFTWEHRGYERLDSVPGSRQPQPLKTSGREIFHSHQLWRSSFIFMRMSLYPRPGALSRFQTLASKSQLYVSTWVCTGANQNHHLCSTCPASCAPSPILPHLNHPTGLPVRWIPAPLMLTATKSVPVLSPSLAWKPGLLLAPFQFLLHARNLSNGQMGSYRSMP